ncbi:multidrug transporter [Limosilactobacillus reuteri]|uniref:multidrug transporter n=1 Tax=Limosilactobacillus reuteri TaxID=1598 RepID=UPI001E4B8BAC|nr:multidrug transporter [Limosilactobacillus reuteri]MCC4325838.1 multidrug transporter [Limosilactobacillus reuteri]MCC4330139.1 multidrug transporter [Limosilactobacillus reuteri]MCC4351722.1 multidrug transporter [Limosilactobacillus reuteri]MCC4376746.1 multidrug transporter [Limosilactobacillus reuteri]
MNNISKSDWQLFNKLLPKWQERYINRLNQEYKKILDSDDSPSNKFWKLEKRIKADRKSPGVMVEVSKRSVFQTLLQLILEKVITDEDLNGFSEELRDGIDDVVKRLG